MHTRLMVIDFYHCREDVLRCKTSIESVLLEAATAGGAHVVGTMFHEFQEGGKGVTGVLLLSESHLSIHTWPEHNRAAIDLFACGNIAFDAILQVLKTKFAPQECRVNTVVR